MNKFKKFVISLSKNPKKRLIFKWSFLLAECVMFVLYFVFFRETILRYIFLILMILSIAFSSIVERISETSSEILKNNNLCHVILGDFHICCYGLISIQIILAFLISELVISFFEESLILSPLIIIGVFCILYFLAIFVSTKISNYFWNKLKK